MWSKGHELKYWNKNGLAKGTHIYNLYRKAFDLDDYDFEGQKIADIGCGPFGGVFYDCNDIDYYPIDILSEEYNALGHCKQKIIYGDLSNKLPFDDDFFDYIICTNAIDHIPKVKHGFNEIKRVLTPGGVAFIHVHARTQKEVDKAHVHSLNSVAIQKYMQNFVILEIQDNTDWVNDRDDRKAIYITIQKIR